MSIIDLKLLKKIPFRYELKPYGNIILTYTLNYILMRSNVAVINTFQNGHHIRQAKQLIEGCCYLESPENHLLIQKFYTSIANSLFIEEIRILVFLFADRASLLMSVFSTLQFPLSLIRLHTKKRYPNNSSNTLTLK